MNRRPRDKEGKAAIDLIEEAFHLLRLAPLRVWLLYYAGSAPFVLAALFFWSDMSRSAFAENRLVGGATGLTVLFVWMKLWQSLFAREVHARCAARAAASPGIRGLARIALAQSALQPVGLLLFPLAFVAVLPAAYVYAFFQSVTALASGEDGRVVPLTEKAWRHALLWQQQNHFVLSIFFIFGLFVLLNWMVLGLVVPALMKTLLGIQTATLSPQAMLNSTFIAAAAGLTYLTLDPFLKAVYVLRCFYGDALKTGDDLRSELRSFRSATKAIAVAALLFLLAPAAPGAPAAGEARAQTVSPEQLDASIERVIRQREYAWRLPREKVREKRPENEPETFWEKLQAHMRELHRKIDAFVRRIFSRRTTSGGPIADWALFSRQSLVWVLIVSGTAVAVILLLRAWRLRRNEAPAVVSQGLAPAPDLTSEDVDAAQMPEEGWLRVAHELIERGELRLAIRALYLAALAHLAARHLITVAKYKSNREYEMELRRRSHALPELFSAFAETVGIFERIWYGAHEVNDGTVRQFTSDVERIRTC